VRFHEVTDATLLAAYHAVESASFDHDHVALPADAVEELLPVVEGHQPSGEHQTFWVGCEDAQPVASVCLTRQTLDNLTSASLDVHVHPEHRRRGLGREAVAFGLDRVRAVGRTRVFFESPWTLDGQEGPAFGLLRSVGAHPVLVDVRRLLDLQAFPVGEPLPPPPGYRVVQWADRAPQELLDGLAYLLHRMVLDAPMGELGYEAEAWDAARYRATEASAQRQSRSRIVTAAVHEASGAVAGVTEIVKNAQRHEVAFQWNTIVDPDHRGQRLGLVLKGWNHRQLVEQVPGVRWVNTWNAASNTFMIAVNEQLGYRPVEQWTEWQLDL
jgi:GNAT superfamily N-acetyltransferase